MKMVIGIDESTGSSSAVGVAVVSSNLEVLATFALMPKKRFLVTEKRLQCLAEQLEANLAPYISFAIENQMIIDVVFEQFVMKGKAGESLAKSVGSFITSIPQHDRVSFHYVHNLQMKQFIAGTGTANKLDIAKGLLKHLPQNEHETIIKLTNTNSYDSLDAIGLATTHLLRDKHVKKAPKSRVNN